MDLKFIVEAILFSAQKPLNLKEIRDVFAGAVDHAAEDDETVRSLKKVKEDQLTLALEELAKDHEAAGRSYRLVCVAGSWQFVTQPEFAPWLKALVGHKSRPPRLSHPAMETLAIIAYRQPLTRTDIEQIRGVAVDGVMQTLLERGLVEQRGRAEVVGRPMTYGTTPLFLEYFGLPNLEALPAADELRRIPVQKAEPLATDEAGAATASPEQQQQQSPADAAQPAQPEAPAAAESAPASESVPAPESAAEPAPELTPETESAPAPESEPDSAPEAEPTAEAESQAEPEPTAEPESTTAPESTIEPEPVPAAESAPISEEAPALSESSPAVEANQQENPDQDTPAPKKKNKKNRAKPAPADEPTPATDTPV